MSLKQLQEGDRFTGVYLMRAVQIRETRTGSTFLDFELTDKTGRLFARWFAPDIDAPSDQPVPVKVVAFVESFNNKPLAKISELTLVASDNVDWDDLIAGPKRPMLEMMDDLRTRVAAMKDEWYKKLMLALLEDEQWFKRYSEAPAGKLWHHTYRSALLEHSLCIADHCALAAEHHSAADRDLLLCGAILHDAGKVWELSPLPAADYTEAGRMLGHIFIGANFVSRKMEAISGFPVRHRMRLLHLILSHQGQREKGSPILPAMVEAIILHHADELDAHAEAFERIIMNNEGSGKVFTDYVPLAGTYLYTGDRGVTTDSVDDDIVE